eukprot:353393-Chlamydomonas_euryale.AAC.6
MASWGGTLTGAQVVVRQLAHTLATASGRHARQLAPAVHVAGVAGAALALAPRSGRGSDLGGASSRLYGTFSFTTG